MTISIDTKPMESIPLTVSASDVITVGETRVTLDTVVGAFQNGATPEEIVYQYPALNLADVYAVIGYYLKHQELVAEYLETRQRQAQEIRQENEQRFPSEGVRSRLLARQDTSAA